MFDFTPAQYRAIFRIVGIALSAFCGMVFSRFADRAACIQVHARLCGRSFFLLSELANFPRRGDLDDLDHEEREPSYRADRPVEDGKLAEVDYAAERVKKVELLGEVRVGAYIAIVVIFLLFLLVL